MFASPRSIADDEPGLQSQGSSWSSLSSGTSCASSSRHAPVLIQSGEQYVPYAASWRKSGRSDLHVRLPQDAAFYAVHKDAPLKPGSHAFVLVPGERRLRISTHAAHFGNVAGHPQLATEASVLFAGEVLLGETGEVLAWSNMSGTYRPPRGLAAQVDLPLDLLWVVMPVDELRSELRSVEADSNGSARHDDQDVSSGDDDEQLPTGARLSWLCDVRFGPGNYIELAGGELLVRDMMRCPVSERQPLPPGAWTPPARCDAHEPRRCHRVSC